MANVLKKDKQLAVVQLLVEGNSLRSIVRITGVNLRTCLRILVKVGNACQLLLDERMRDLTPHSVRRNLDLRSEEAKPRLDLQ